MNKLLLSIIGVTAYSLVSFAQTTLFTENFETGGTSMSLNTATLGGTVGLAGDNAWVINSSYLGGSGTSSCFGLSFSIGNTPAQPAGISNQNGNYLHILSDDGSSNGILNANYSAADGSFCFFAQSHFCEMTTDISTIGYTNVELDFWWTCLGDVNAYGEAYYSIDGGTTWNLINSPVSSYYGSNNWTNQTIANASWDDQPMLRFGFRFNNQVATSGGDPAFSIDDIKITGTQSGGSNAISTTNDVSPAAWCEGTTTSVTVNFTATGTYTTGNVYTAEISDATGSFASPTAIGNLSSTASGALTIPCTVPGTLPAGTGYRIRVLSTNPSVTGSDNGADLVISSAPTVTQDPFTQVCVYDQLFALTGGAPAGGTYTGPGVVAGAFDPGTAGVGTHTIVYTYTDGTGCSNTAQQALVVDACASISEEETDELTIYPNPTSGQLNISGGDYDRLSVMDLSGRKVFESKMLASNKYDVSDVPTGVYLVKVISDKTEKTFRLIKK